ncbi:MAG TPA: beta-galactosidase GalA [Vicinamibacterales bacterium]|jgi:beta-galactosidase|nr:beta-galactosidase GalA [Vicinamibacterales bacterium]
MGRVAPSVVVLALSAFAGGASIHSQSAAPARERILMDEGWRFAFGHTYDVAKDFGYSRGEPFAKAGSAPGALSARFDDSGWRQVDLPHDWVVELPFVDGKASNLESHGYKPVGRSFPETTIGWYRKKFDIPASDDGRRLGLEFDGIFRDSEVWLNGHRICANLSGYIGFACDITDYVNYGGTNQLVVRVDASQVEGWFYEGAGIYRHVWLTKTSPAHIARDGVFVTATVDGRRANVAVKTTVRNDSGADATVVVSHRIKSEAGGSGVVSGPVQVSAWSSRDIELSFQLPAVHLWSLDDPHLYELETSLRTDDRAVDDVSTPFGVRTIRFDKDNGFFLNGERVEIRGVCDHQDHAGVGSAIPDRLNAWRLEQLKKYGVNAVRTSHNPPTPELLDAADRLGILVMDENRLIGSSPEILSQLTRLVTRDRNHPSVIMWSLGNEEPEQSTPRGARIGATMVRTVKALDDSRPVTFASNAHNSDTGIHTVIDLRGFNYKNISDIDKYHGDHPDEILFGSEEASTVSTRGIYANDPVRTYVSAYDVNKPNWGATAEDWWSFYDARPWLAGAFVWTGFDYRGEPTPYSWPSINSHFGILDTCGFPKDIAFYYQAMWTGQPVLHVFPHWNWAGREGEPIDVWAFSNLDAVELKVNGRTAGRHIVPKDGHVEWKVPYQPGALEAIGMKNGRVIKTTRIETTGAPARVVLSADRTTIDADGRDVAIVTVSAVDAQGRVVPIADALIHFAMDGAGGIIGVGNGDPASHEPDRYLDPSAWQRHLFNGYAQVIVQAGGTAGTTRLHAAAEGLQPADLEIVERAPSVSR